MKFLIKSLENPAQFEGSSRVFGTGETPFIAHSENLTAEPVGKDVVRMRTGLSKEDIQTNPMLSDVEKAVYLKALPPVVKRIEERFGKTALDPTNTTFWGGARASLLINNNSFSEILDDDNIEDLIFRWQVIGNGYSSICTSLESAEKNGRRFYLTGEDEFTEKKYEENFGVKRKAIAALDDLLESASTDALVYITWNTVEANQGFNKNTPKSTYEKILMEYIEGKHTKHGKQLCAKKFLDNYNTWKTNKEEVIGTATLNAAKYFGMVFMEDGKFRTNNRNTILGSTIEESFDILMKPENHTEFGELKKEVDSKMTT